MTHQTTNEQRAAQRKRHARLTRGVELLAFLKWRREREGDEGIGRGIEAWVVGRELNELLHLAVGEALAETDSDTGLGDGASWD